MKIIISLLCLVILTTTYSAQESTENWVPVKTMRNQHIYIDVYGIENFKGNDVYIWAMQNFDQPLEMEGIDRDIYQTRTYYLINKKLKEYSILEIVFYDEDGNVIKSYTYQHETDITKYKYNYPIFPGSDMNAILNKCIEYIEK